MNKLRAVSIGGYGHSVLVFDEMQTMQNVQLVGLAPAYAGEDISAFTNHPLCKGVAVYSDYKEMIKKTSADIAIISSRLDTISTVAIDAAKMGCHLICEKPLALSHKALDELYHVIKGSGVKLIAMLTMRDEKLFRAARQAYFDGLIGEAVLANGRKSYKWGSRPEWFGKKEYYGGTIGWVGIHAFDLINFITGLDVTSVAAMQGNFAHPDRKDCQDNCSICFSLSNGGHGDISIDLFRPEAAPTHGDDFIRIVGTRGVLEVRGNTGKCQVINEKGSFDTVLPEKGRMFEDFMLSIPKNSDVTIGMRQAFILTDVCLLARDSADNNVFVKVDLDKWRF